MKTRRRKMSKNNQLVKVKNLKKYFPIKGGIFQRTVDHVHAVDGINLAFPEGKTLGLVGESGSGKTTAGKTIIRLLDVTDGKIVFNGQDIAHEHGKSLKKLRKEMQIVFQDPYASLNPRKTVKATLMEGLLLHDMVNDKIEAKEKAFDFLETVGLKREHLWRYPHELSGGQRQRVCVARALLLEPSFVVLDEPTASLDVSVQARVLNLMKNLQDRFDLTYLFISHNIAVVNYMSDTIAVMYLGQLMEKIPSEKIPKEVLHPYTKLLMRSVPIPNPRKRKEVSLHEVPELSAVDPPEGCRFHPRCPQAKDVCSEEEPEMREIDSDHFVACHLFS